VVESGDCLRFLLEASQAGEVSGHALRQDLESDVTLEPGVSSTVDLSHPARPERAQNHVRAEPSPLRQRHLFHHRRPPRRREALVRGGAGKDLTPPAAEVVAEV